MRALGTLALLLTFAAPAVAQRYALAVDVPATLGGTTGLPSQLLDHTGNGSFALQYALPPRVEIAAVARDGGELLFVAATPVELDGTTYLPSQIVMRDGDGLYSLHTTLALPAGVGIDALFLDSSFQPVVSFDAPVELDGRTWLPADLALIGGAGATLYFEAAGLLPTYANVVAASEDEHGQLVLAFDVPTRVSGFDALPGQLVRFDGSSFTPAPTVTDWPRGVVLHALDVERLDSASGTVGASLTVELLPTGEVRLDWSPSCSGNDVDYGFYAGRLGDFTSHKPFSCTTGGATTWNHSSPVDEYYLVVPTNAFSEGSHGLRSDGSERPRGSQVCIQQEVGACN